MLKQPLSFDEQIERFSAHNIAVSNNASTRNILQRISYYLLTGYALSFRKSPSDSDCLDGTSFEKIYELYCFDEKLRSIIRDYVEIAEVYYKTQIAHWFSLAKCSNPPHDQHYCRDNYYRKESFDDIISCFERERDNYYKDSLIVKHHRAKYNGKMPLWVMVNLLSFSNTSKLYGSMYKSDQQYIASQIGVSVATLTNHLHCLSVLRNKCSHAARLYNTCFMPSAHFPSDFLRRNPDVRSDTLFAYLLVLLKRLPEKKLRTQFKNDLKAIIRVYSDNIDLALIGFPENYEKIIDHNI